MPEPVKPTSKILLRHLRAAVDEALIENLSGDYIDYDEVTRHVECIDGWADTECITESIIEAMTKRGWTFTKQKRK